MRAPSLLRFWRWAIRMPEGFGPLPDAAEEVRQLGSIYGPASAIYTGAEAIEEQWRAGAPAATIVHLATHGVLNDVNPLYSYLVLARGGKDDGLLEVREILGRGPAWNELGLPSAGGARDLGEPVES